MMMPTRPNIGIPLAIAAAFSWAGTAPGIKYLLDTRQLSGLSIAFWRDVFVALACFAALALVRPALLRVGRPALRGLALTGAISIGIYHAIWIWSVALNGAAVAVVLIYLYPTFVTIGSRLLYGEPIRRAQVAGLALALIGCALIVRIYDPAVLRVSWLGALVGVMSAMAHTVYVLASQRAVQTINPWAALAYTMLFGSLVLLLLNLVAAPQQLFAIGDPTNWLILAALAIGPTLGGYGLFTLALQYIPSRTASLLTVLEAPVAALIAVLLLGERLEWPQILGMALILFAVALPQLVARNVPLATPEQMLSQG
ncbi:MAG TPA: DMT family transporter [Roseiflexaceae bacterium]|nr:DMT family transporter [Roseiflexaceae bacterium]HMP40071.1 DMT family transporter [Roseiflexaceae bacterium]